MADQVGMGTVTSDCPPDAADFADLLRLAAGAARGEEAWAHFVEGLAEPVRRRILGEFFLWQAHGAQAEPPAPWRTWLIRAGRGHGKTRAGAEWVCAMARAHPHARIALVAGSREEAVRVMIEGESGLLAVAGGEEEMLWMATKGVATFASGAQAFVYSAAAPETLRGPEHHFAWCDELAKWRRADAAWDNLQMGLRLGARPRAVVTTSRRAMPPAWLRTSGGGSHLLMIWAMSELLRPRPEPRVVLM